MNSELEMCNQVQGFHRGIRKFIAKIQMAFLNCADINLNSYLFPSQPELKVIGHHNTYVRPKVIKHFVKQFSDQYYNFLGEHHLKLEQVNFSLKGYGNIFFYYFILKNF